MIALRHWVPVTIRLELMVAELVRVPPLDLVRFESIDDPRVELVHLLALDYFVTQVSDWATGGETAASGGGPDLRGTDTKGVRTEGKDGEGEAGQQ